MAPSSSNSSRQSSNYSRHSSAASPMNTALPRRSQSSTGSSNWVSPTIYLSSTQAHVNPSGSHRPSSVSANLGPVLGAGYFGARAITPWHSKWNSHNQITEFLQSQTLQNTQQMVPPANQSGPSPPNPHLTQQFLSSILSQLGSSALTYSEVTKWLIHQHLVSLTDAYPSLEPKTATFNHNDGRSVNLLQADGTIPMSFQGVTSNIPVVIWLVESYPRQPPYVYVNPTRDMIIKRPHAHVNPSGMVSVPYLQNWVYPSSNLVDLVWNLSMAFGRDPPLYSQRGPNPNPNPNPSPSPVKI